MTIALLAATLALAAGGPAAPPAAASAPAPAAPEPRDWEKPPPGSKADQALWQSARDVNTELVIEQHTAARLTQGAKASGYEERLPELAKSGALPRARADELAAKLVQKWTANLEIVRRQWPVSRTRVCQYELLNFESLMAATSVKESQMTDARRTLVECVDRANTVLKPLRRSNEELRAVLAEVEREVKPLTAAAASPAPAGSATVPAGTATPPAKTDVGPEKKP